MIDRNNPKYYDKRGFSVWRIDDIGSALWDLRRYVNKEEDLDKKILLSYIGGMLEFLESMRLTQNILIDEINRLEKVNEDTD